TNSISKEDYFWTLKLDIVHPGMPIPLGINVKSYCLEMIAIESHLEIANIAVSRGYTRLLDWLPLDNNFVINSEYLDEATKRGDVDIITWVSHNTNTFIGRCLSTAVSNGKLEIVKLIADAENVCPSQYHAKLAHKYNHTHLLEWMATLDIHP